MSVTPEYLTVPELAELLRIKERKVYDLASAGEVPCTRATGKLLFPTNQVRAWIDAKQSGAVKRPSVFLGSHDPLLEWALRQSRCGLATYFDGSGNGIEKFNAGEGIATGLHLQDPDGKDWNISKVRESCAETSSVLLTWATRKRGLIVREGGANFQKVADVVGQRVAVRQSQSGTANVWDRLMQEAALEPSAVKTVGPFHSEQDATIAVAEGVADVTLGLEAMAQQFNLGFVPLLDEKFDLLVDRAAYFEPPFQSFLAFCEEREFSARARSFRGYEVAGIGAVRWNS